MIRLLIGGDFCPYKVEENVRDKFVPLIELLKNVDFSIVNFECPIDISGNHLPIKKVGPSLKTSSTNAKMLKTLGFNAVTLANNHFKDYGKRCCEESMQYLRENNIDFVGAGRNKQEANETLYKTIKDTTIAFINCCEEEFSIATEDEAGSNPLNSIKQYYAIKNAKEIADIVIVIVHAGVEMYNFPTPKMQERYRFFIDCGADLVVNHHQHCYSGMEIYNKKSIYYGLGNLYFPSFGKSSRAWYEGFVIIVSIDNKSIIGIETIPYTQSYDEGIVIGDTFNFEESFKVLNNVCKNSEEVERKYDKLVNKDLNSYNFINPYNNRILRGAARRGWIPSFVSKKSYLELMGKIRCESHYQRLIRFLEDKNK